MYKILHWIVALNPAVPWESRTSSDRQQYQVHACPQVTPPVGYYQGNYQYYIPLFYMFCELQLSGTIFLSPRQRVVP